MLSNIYRPMHHLQSAETTPLSHELEKLVARLPFPQLVEAVQSSTTNPEVDRFLKDGTATVQNWAYRRKVAISLPERTGTLFEQAENYISLTLPNPTNPATQRTYKRIAGLGAANETFLYALKWLDHLQGIVANNQMWWREPLVNLSIDSEIVFEWWYENKKLTVYILGNTAEYVQVWGPDIDDQMQEGPATSSVDLISLWTWLVT